MKIRQRGIITEAIRGGRFQVALQEIPDHTVLTRPSGKMRKRKIALCLGDDVTVEMSVRMIWNGVGLSIGTSKEGERWSRLN